MFRPVLSLAFLSILFIGALATDLLPVDSLLGSVGSPRFTIPLEERQVTGVIDPAQDEYTLPDEIMYAHFIDVGQADATLLEFPCGAMLIDAGAQDTTRIADLLDYLNEFFARRPDLDHTLEAIIITHNHVDHTRALREIIERFNVHRLVENGQRGGREGDRDVVWASTHPGLTIIDVDHDSNSDIDPIDCEPINPRIVALAADRTHNPGWPQDEFENKNNHSVVVRVDFGDSSFLFTGDFEDPAIELLVEDLGDSGLLDVDVYQVGHHGSGNGTTWSLVEKMSPQLAVISMGSWEDQGNWTAWAYGHPRKEAIEILQQGVTGTRSSKEVHIAEGQRSFYKTQMSHAIYATGWDGTVSVRATSGGQLRPTTQH